VKHSKNLYIQEIHINRELKKAIQCHNTSQKEAQEVISLNTLKKEQWAQEVVLDIFILQEVQGERHQWGKTSQDRIHTETKDMDTSQHNLKEDLWNNQIISYSNNNLIVWDQEWPINKNQIIINHNLTSQHHKISNTNPLQDFIHILKVQLLETQV
jgi:hypothetical protein